MAPGGGYPYTPVQVQKLLFLIDRQIPQFVGGPHFNFEAYHYGPFDASVYHELEQLAVGGFVTIDRTCAPRTFALTPDGLNRGATALGTLPSNIRDFVRRTSEFVRVHSFSSLVSAIYKAFPEMRANSVFQS
jgi:hypothetical protein